MDNQLAKPQLKVQQLITVAMVTSLMVLLIIVTIRWNQPLEPYIQEVLALEGHQSRGEAIFQANCTVCHGLGASSSVGPSLLHVSRRKSKVSLIEQVISGETPPMPKFQPKEQDMADLLSYLEII